MINVSFHETIDFQWFFQYRDNSQQYFVSSIVYEYHERIHDKDEVVPIDKYQRERTYRFLLVIMEIGFEKILIETVSHTSHRESISMRFSSLNIKLVMKKERKKNTKIGYKPPREGVFAI